MILTKCRRWKARIKFLLINFIIFIEGLLISIPSQRAKSGIALVRLDAIGDFVIWLDTAKLFKNLYPDQKIVLIANESWSDFAKELPYWDEVLPLNVKRFHPMSLLYRWLMMKKIANRSFATIIQPTYSRDFLLGDSVIRASKATTRIGSSGDLSNISKSNKLSSDKWFTKLIASQKTGITEIERNADFIFNLTGTQHPPNLSKLRKLKELRSDLQIDGDYFVIFPGASWSGKRWPTHCFSEIINEINKRQGMTAVLCGSSEDNELCSEVILKCKRKVINFAGKTSLSELIEVIRSAKILVSNDTSAVHIAASVSTPSVCILGGGHYGRFLPYPKYISGIHPLVAVNAMDCFGCNWNCTKSYDRDQPVPCIESISIEDVMKQVNKIMGHRRFNCERTGRSWI